MKPGPALLVLGAVVLGSCSSPSAGSVIAQDPWVRSTQDTQRPDMTALFVNLTNPTSQDVTLISADCGDVAGLVELHSMEMVDGEPVMSKSDQGHIVPAESHLHLAPGGPHVMLMELTRELPVGGEEIECSLGFDNGQTIELSAPIKEFTEEQDTYHEH